MNSPKVFISYDHSSPEHMQAVADLAEVLRSKGLTIELDIDHILPPQPTIGIITALPKEFAAVKAILIEPKERSVAGKGAGRRYMIGRINSLYGGSHLIDLALADMGNNIAATRATLLLEHFPHVDSIIMVGIAGGVPCPSHPEEHVRLGDIVISNKKGVVQYDMVKLHEIRACPVPPNARLIEAVRLLEARELEGQRPWDAAIDEILKLLKWDRPSKTTDQLFASDDPSKLIKHPKDPKRAGNLPHVFLGPIASANELLKNPIKRDNLRSEFGVKAVEMESSGIADATWTHEKGYLAVRGICDYCDSHKNDLWQNYAAAVAAGYTKALIESVFDQTQIQSKVVSASMDWLYVPNREWHATPSSLLRADHAIVPFHGREEELTAWKNWVLDDSNLGARLLTGSGGMGKTRFARELCLHLHSVNVQAGFLDLAETEQCLEYLKAVANERILLVVDYAETAEEKVANILRIAAKRKLTSLRLILLARGAGYWWSRLKRKGDGVGDWLWREPDKLRPLALDISGRQESYNIAIHAFAEKLGMPVKASELSNLSAPYYERILVLHMTALLAVLGSTAAGMDSIIERILDHEASNWIRQVRNRELPTTLDRGFERAMGIISVYGGVSDRHEAIELIRKIRFFRDQPLAIIETVADILHDCYPGPPWIEPIQPDLLMEYLVGKATKDDPEDFIALILPK